MTDSNIRREDKPGRKKGPRIGGVLYGAGIIILPRGVDLLHFWWGTLTRCADVSSVYHYIRNENSGMQGI